MPIKLIEHNGRKLSISAWARYAGLKPQTLTRRLASGMDIATALTKPLFTPHVRNCKQCGKEFNTPPSSNKRACSIACRRKMKSSAWRHGCEPKRLYNIWCDMKSRVKGTAGELARRYYSHVKMSVEWSRDFAAFRDWALSNGYEDHLEIDRIDRDGHYEPSNCRWATRKQQMCNTRTRNDPRKLSRFRGVAKCSRSNAMPWRATGHEGGRPVHIGVYKTEMEAALAYDAWAKVHYGEYASLNFKDGESSKAG